MRILWNEPVRMDDGIELLNAIQDVYLDDNVTIA